MQLFEMAHWCHFHTPHRMLRTLRREELFDLFAYFQLDPPTQRRADMRAMASAMLGAGGGDPPNPVYPFYGTSLEEELAMDAMIDELERNGELAPMPETEPNELSGGD